MKQTTDYKGLNGNKLSNAILVSLLTFLFLGCGSGSSGDKNQGPVISFEIPDSVNEGETITLSITASDPDGSIREYDWEQVSGPDVDFTENRNSITFTAPQVDAETILQFLVRVVDNVGAVTSAQLTITVNDLTQKEKLSQLSFSKVSSSNAVEDERWIELINKGDSEIELSDFYLKAQSVNMINLEVFEDGLHQLPSFVLKPGQSIVVSDSMSRTLWGTINSDLEIEPDSEYNLPYWSNVGTLSLINMANDLEISRFELARKSDVE